jgi:DNA-directed RNA polymerase subunit N (RpoN/RPB10)
MSTKYFETITGKRSPTPNAESYQKYDYKVKNEYKWLTNQNANILRDLGIETASR